MSAETRFDTASSDAAARVIRRQRIPYNIKIFYTHYYIRCIIPKTTSYRQYDMPQSRMPCDQHRLNVSIHRQSDRVRSNNRASDFIKS